MNVELLLLIVFGVAPFVIWWIMSAPTEQHPTCGCERVTLPHRDSYQVTDDGVTHTWTHCG